MANEYAVNQADMKAVADAIRSKGGTSDALTFPGGFVDAVDAIEAGGEDTAAAVVSRTVTEFISSACTSIGQYAFRECVELKTVDAPNATIIGGYGFYNCEALVSVNLPSVTTVGNFAFQGCNNLKKIALPSATELASNSFRDTRRVEFIDVPHVTNIPTLAFYGCRGLSGLILRSETMVTLENTDAFTSCYRLLGTKNASFNPNGEKIGFIYVPAALMEQYAANTTWTSTGIIFRALEDYTVDGTITGELDESKT